jgi:glutamate-5-semialdehyde dehydrogenase
MSTSLESAVAELQARGRAAKAASRPLAYLSAEVKDRALHNIADDLLARKDEVLAANLKDCQEAEASGLDAAMQDRLRLDEKVLAGIAGDVRTVAALPDPVGEMFDVRTLPNGLLIGRRRVPLGVIGCMYESRPNVTIDISVLCLKAGNAVILRGGKEALHSNRALVGIVQDACTRAGVPEGAVQFVDNTDRSLVEPFLKMKDAIDLFIPRGGAGLIKFVRDTATMPVVAGGIGVCHTYVDQSADLDKAVAIVYNAKVQKPSVCNALDTMLVHRAIAERFLPPAAAELNRDSVELRCDDESMAILKADGALKLQPATEEDFDTEFLSLRAAVRVVDSLQGALDHIRDHGSGHSEAIVTEDYGAAMRFLDEVDAACVYVNASTRFTDGGQFGLGAEVGISTQKMHARGPLGVRELTSYKWTIFGTGQVRP